MEKSWEHQAKIFILFIDIEKPTTQCHVGQCGKLLPGGGAKLKKMRSSKGHMGCRCELRSIHAAQKLVSALTARHLCLFMSLPLRKVCEQSGPCTWLSAWALHLVVCLTSVLLSVGGVCTRLCRCEATLPLMSLPCHTMRLQWCASPQRFRVFHSSIASSGLLWDGIQVTNWTGWFSVCVCRASDQDVQAILALNCRLSQTQFPYIPTVSSSSWMLCAGPTVVGWESKVYWMHNDGKSWVSVGPSSWCPTFRSIHQDEENLGLVHLAFNLHSQIAVVEHGLTKCSKGFWGLHYSFVNVKVHPLVTLSICLSPTWKGVLYAAVASLPATITFILVCWQTSQNHQSPRCTCAEHSQQLLWWWQVGMHHQRTAALWSSIPLHCGYISWTTFGHVCVCMERAVMVVILRSYGVPQELMEIIEELYVGTWCHVRALDGTSQNFEVKTIVRQGCVKSPIVFNCYVYRIQKEAAETLGWLHVKNTTAGGLFLTYCDQNEASTLTQDIRTVPYAPDTDCRVKK